MTIGIPYNSPFQEQGDFVVFGGFIDPFGALMVYFSLSNLFFALLGRKELL